MNDFNKDIPINELPLLPVDRRVRFENVMEYKKESQRKQEGLLTEMMKSDEELGLYGA